LKNYDLILASQSPRRKYLLEQVGLEFKIVPSQVDEQYVSGTSPENLVKNLAEAKAKEVAASFPEHWIIGADTIVLIDGRILGKPDSVESAREMIQQLNGKRHQVLTGYAICNTAKNTSIIDMERTNVYFKLLSQAEIEWYLHTDEPFDKAGAYAIQGLGMFLVKHIKGSYTNVVGLPVCEVLDHLYQAGVIEPGLNGRWRICNLNQA
jgi:septum formation protein